MRDQLMQLVLWAAYFATDIYGHTAFKALGEGNRNTLSIVFSVGGMSAALAWAVSALLWITILSGSKLLQASSIGAITYILMVAAAAFVFEEAISPRQLLGVGLILAGVYFVTQ